MQSAYTYKSFELAPSEISGFKATIYKIELKTAITGLQKQQKYEIDGFNENGVSYLTLTYDH